MKLKTRTSPRLRIDRPKVRLTDTEILADLLYPAPISDETIERQSGDKPNGGR